MTHLDEYNELSLMASVTWPDWIWDPGGVPIVFGFMDKCVCLWNPFLLVNFVRLT